MAEAEIMAEEMQSPKKVAFAQRKYTNEEKRKLEEEELEQLIKEQKGEVEEQEPEPESSEEKTFKKRYGDLRRHVQEKEAEFKKQLEELKGQLDAATRKEMKLPKSDEDLEAWSKSYPDVAAIVETIAAKKAQEQTQSLEERFKQVDEMQYTAKKEKAEAELMRLHPDFDEIRENDDFHDWASEQPKWVQEALYENDDDAHLGRNRVCEFAGPRGHREEHARGPKVDQYYDLQRQPWARERGARAAFATWHR